MGLCLCIGACVCSAAVSFFLTRNVLLLTEQNRELCGDSCSNSQSFPEKKPDA